MSGKWIYEVESQLHKCSFPKIKRGEHNPGSIWECDCGLQYELTNRGFLKPAYCGKAICVKQGGHPGNCNF